MTQVTNLSNSDSSFKFFEVEITDTQNINELPKQIAKMKGADLACFPGWNCQKKEAFCCMI